MDILKRTRFRLLDMLINVIPQFREKGRCLSSRFAASIGIELGRRLALPPAMRHGVQVLKGDRS